MLCGFRVSGYGDRGGGSVNVNDFRGCVGDGSACLRSYVYQISQALSQM